MNSQNLADLLTAHFAFKRSQLQVQAAQTQCNLAELEMRVAQEECQLAALQCQQAVVENWLQLLSASQT